MYCFIFNGGSWKLDYILRRLSHILVGSVEYYKQKDGYDYMIGNDNNWWVDVHEDTGNFEVYCRFPKSDGDCQALQRAVCVLLGVDKDNGYNREFEGSKNN